MKTPPRLPQTEVSLPLSPDEFIDLLLHSTDDGIFLLNAVGRVQLWSAGMERICGLTAAEATGEPLYQALPFLRPAQQPDLLPEVLAGRQHVTDDLRFVQPVLGRERWCRITFRPFQTASGTPGVLGVLRDVSAEKEALAELESSRSFIEQVTNAVPAVISVFDLQLNRTVFSNKYLLHLLHYNTEELQLMEDQMLPQLMHPDDLAELPEAVSRLRQLADGEVHTTENRIRDKDGRYHWVQSANTVFSRDPDGQVREVLSISQDIGESKRMKTLLKGVLDSSLNGIMAFESVRNEQGEIVDFRYVLVNEAAASRINQKVSDLMGTTLKKYLKAVGADYRVQNYIRVVETGEPYEFEHLYTQQNLHTWFHTSAVKMGDGFVITFADITQRKLAEQKLLENQVTAVKINNSLPFVLLVYQLEGLHLQYTNRQLAHHFGYSVEEVQRMGLATFLQLVVHPKDYAHLQEHLAQLRTAAEGEWLELRFKARPKKGRWKRFHTRDCVFRRDTPAGLEVLSVMEPM